MWTELKTRNGYVRVAPLRLAECGYDLFLSSQGRCLFVSVDNVPAYRRTNRIHPVYGLDVAVNCRPQASAMNRVAWAPSDRPAPTGPYYGYLFCKIYHDGPIGQPNRLHRIVIGLVGSRTRSMRPIGPIHPRSAAPQHTPIRYERFVANRLISWWSTAPLKQETPCWRTKTH